MADEKKPVERRFIKAGEEEETPKKAPRKAAKAEEAEEKPVKKQAPKKEKPEKEEVEKEPEAEEVEETEAVEEDEEKAEKKPARGKDHEYIEVDHSGSGKTRAERAKGFRIGAWVLWLVGIAFEVLAILMLNKTMYVAPEKFNLFFFGALAVDLVAVVIASQLWKKANHIDPASEANKAKFVLHNNLGVIMSIIAFLPILILLLRNKDLDKKTKKIASIVAAAALLVAGLSSVDYHPVSQEQLAEAKQEVEQNTDGTVYWTQFGKSYHYDPDCHTIKNSKNVYYGTIEEAFEAKRSDPCDYCAKEDAAKLTEELPAA